MKKLIGVVVGLLVFVVSTLAGVTFFLSSSSIEVSGNYDLPPVQTKTFVQAASRKLGWQASRQPDEFDASVLPWSKATVTVTVEPKDKGSHVQIKGHATKVRELDTLLKRQLPPLQ